jgi:hypothetical protein
MHSTHRHLTVSDCGLWIARSRARGSLLIFDHPPSHHSRPPPTSTSKLRRISRLGFWCPACVPGSDGPPLAQDAGAFSGWGGPPKVTRRPIRRIHG